MPAVLTYYRHLDGHTEQPAGVPARAARGGGLAPLDRPRGRERGGGPDPHRGRSTSTRWRSRTASPTSTCPKVDDYTDYLFLVVHGIRFDAPTDQFETRELDIFLGPNYLVTHHKGPMRSIAFARDLCGKDLQVAVARGADFLLHQILDRMFENYFPSLDAIEDKMQLVQVEVFENPTPGTLDRIFTLKRDVMQLRRICTPEREILHRLSRGEFRVVSAEGGRLLPRHLRQPLPHRGRHLLLPGHDPGHARRLPLRDQQPAQRDHEATHRAHRGAGLAHRHHRRLRDELRAHARAALALRLPRGRSPSWSPVPSAIVLWARKKKWL